MLPGGTGEADRSCNSLSPVTTAEAVLPLSWTTPLPVDPIPVLLVTKMEQWCLAGLVYHYRRWADPIFKLPALPVVYDLTIYPTAAILKVGLTEITTTLALSFSRATNERNTNAPTL